jgi:hypothetical protein
VTPRGMDIPCVPRRSPAISLIVVVADGIHYAPTKSHSQGSVRIRIRIGIGWVVRRRRRRSCNARKGRRLGCLPGHHFEKAHGSFNSPFELLLLYELVMVLLLILPVWSLIVSMSVMLLRRLN